MCTCTREAGLRGEICLGHQGSLTLPGLPGVEWSSEVRGWGFLEHAHRWLHLRDGLRQVGCVS